MNSKTMSHVEDWLFKNALPIWLDRSVDKVNGGTLEQLALDGSPSDAGFKRVRVPARQIYVFSHACLLGWEPGLGEAKRQYDVFVATAWQGREKGWAKTLTSDNQILDPTIDLYDNAFALFALSWYYRASTDEAARLLAIETAICIDTNLRHPKIGFWHQIPPSGPRLQNPHMHLLEASLACLEAFHDPLIERLAREVVGLFQNQFYCAERGTLGEYFDDDLNLLEHESGEIIEPGHQMEWVWILSKAQSLLGIDLMSQARGLTASSQRLGVHLEGPMRGTTKNKVTIKGVNLDAGSRTWPNTERLKAAVAKFELFGEDPAPVISQTLEAMFRLHLNHPTKGLWYDAFDETGRQVASAIPTSTFYHVFLAFAEVMRINKTG